MKTRELAKSVNWLELNEMIQLHTLTFTWKTMKLRKPRHLYDKISMDADNNLSTSVPRLQNSESSIRWRMCKSWNEMTLEMKKIESLPRFKRTVKNWIKSCRDNTPVPLPPNPPVQLPGPPIAPVGNDSQAPILLSQAPGLQSENDSQAPILLSQVTGLQSDLDPNDSTPPPVLPTEEAGPTPHTSPGGPNTPEVPPPAMYLAVEDTTSTEVDRPTPGTTLEDAQPPVPPETDEAGPTPDTPPEAPTPVLRIAAVDSTSTMTSQ